MVDALAEKLDERLREWKPPNRRPSTCSMNPQPGEIWLADLGLAAKTRPVVLSPVGRN